MNQDIKHLPNGDFEVKPKEVFYSEDEMYP